MRPYWWTVSACDRSLVLDAETGEPVAGVSFGGVASTFEAAVAKGLMRPRAANQAIE